MRDVRTEALIVDGFHGNAKFFALCILDKFHIFSALAAINLDYKKHRIYCNRVVERFFNNDCMRNLCSIDLSICIKHLTKRNHLALLIELMNRDIQFGEVAQFT